MTVALTGKMYLAESTIFQLNNLVFDFWYCKVHLHASSIDFIVDGR